MEENHDDGAWTATGGGTNEFEEEVRVKNMFLVEGRSKSPDPTMFKKKGKLQRSERLQSETSNSSMSAWEALLKESFGNVAWPIKIKSWELVDDIGQKVTYR